MTLKAMAFLGRHTLRLRSCTPVLSSCRTLLVASGSSGEETKTMSQVIQELTASVIGGPSTYDPDEYNRRRQVLMKYVPTSQGDLPGRRMVDSFDSAVIPLGSDKLIRDR